MRRSTLILHETTFRAVKALAAREGRTLSHVVNELLEDGLRERGRSPRRQFRLRSFEMGPPGVDIDDREALHAFLDREDAAEKVSRR